MHRSERAPGDCTGAMLAGGRWHPSGTPMLYTAENLSLACIEILVYLDKGQPDHAAFEPYRRSSRATWDAAE